jgi:hypothetical protein
MLSNKTMGFIVHTGSPQSPVPSIGYFAQRKYFFGDLGCGQVKQRQHGSYPIDCYILHLLVWWSWFSIRVFTFASTCLVLLWMDFHPCIYIYTYRISSARALTIAAPPAHLDEVWPLFGSSGPQRSLKTHKIQWLTDALDTKKITVDWPAYYWPRLLELIVSLFAMCPFSCLGVGYQDWEKTNRSCHCLGQKWQSTNVGNKISCGQRVEAACTLGSDFFRRGWGCWIFVIPNMFRWCSHFVPNMFPNFPNMFP